MAITQTFAQLTLQGTNINNPTSIQFGPDGRLYVSQQNGVIKIYDVTKVGDVWQASNEEVINLVNEIPNHDDEGNLQSGVNNRQVTGIVVEGTADNPIIYVSSSDPRIGAGGSGNDTGLDTNSGIISRLTTDGDSWTKVDLVIGLPRSEENHATNGMDIRFETVMIDGQPELREIMYVQSGGHANKGAPSNNFAWTPEYYYSAAILRIDLTQLAEIEQGLLGDGGLNGGTDYVDEYVYALPTLDDPTRENNSEVVGDGALDSASGTTGPVDYEAADTFGGNDGRNQAKFDPGGPVQVYSPGYRNAYDVVITEAGNIYTFDNGPNNGWGGDVVDSTGTAEVTDASQTATNAPNLTDNTSDQDQDNLHILQEGTYGGHPNPTRAAGEAAGLWSGGGDGLPFSTQLTANNETETLWDDLPADWSTITGGNSNPIEGVYFGPDTNPGPKDESILSIGSSSNGLTEYTADNIGDGGTDVEYLAVVSFNGNLTLIEVATDGTALGSTVTDTESINVGGTPLDVTALGNGGIPGSGGVGSGALFVAQFGSDQIAILEPGDPPGVDLDADNDGVLDINDPLQFDPDNGTTIVLEGGQSILWDFNPAGGSRPADFEYNIGFSGWMIDGAGEINPDVLIDNPTADLLTDLDNTIRGGAPGVIQIKSVTDGDAFGTNNSQNDAIQTGFTPSESVETFTIRVPIFNPYSSVSLGDPFGSVGFALGDGTQSNYLKVVAGVDGNGPRLQVYYEENDAGVVDISVDGDDDPAFADAAANATGNAEFELYLTVDLSNPNAVTAQAFFNYKLTPEGDFVLSEPNPIGGEITLQGEVLKAVLGQKTIQDEGGNDLPSSAVVTLLATSFGTQEPFEANFVDLEITSTEKEVEPVAVDDEAATLPGQPVVINVADLLINDTDANVGDTLEITGVQNASGGTAVLNDAGTPEDAGDDFITFTPGEGFEGIATFDYIVEDSDGLTDIGTVSVTVTDVEVLYRVNAGGAQIAATDDGPDWAANTGTGAQTGDGFSNNTGNLSSPSAVVLTTTGPNAVPDYVPLGLFGSERWDPPAQPEMEFTFDASVSGTYTVNLFMADGFSGTAAAGARVFDISIEDVLVEDGLDLIQTLGDQTAGMFSYDVEVTDGVLNILWEHDIENPLINAIEIIGPAQGPSLPEVSILGSDQSISEDGTSVGISIASDVQIPANEQVDVTIEIASGTAVAGADFTYAGGTLENGVYTVTLPIAGGSSDLTLDINIVDDALEELAEAFTVTITGVSANATIGTASQSVTITDNDTVIDAGDILYRVNSGGPVIAATDGGPDWSADTGNIGANGNSPYLLSTGTGTSTYNNNAGSSYDGTVASAPNVPGNIPLTLFDTERYDPGTTAPQLVYQFDVGTDYGLQPGDEVEVRLYFAEIFGGVVAAGERVFDVAVDGVVPTAFDDIDAFVETGGGNIGFVRSYTATVDAEGLLDISFINGVENPAVKGIEILAATDDVVDPAVVSIGAPTPDTVEETGDTDFTTLIFPVTFDAPPTAYTEVSYEVDINGAVTAGTLALGVLDGQISVNVPNDDAENGPEDVTVTLTGIVTGPAILGTASAMGSVTEDDTSDDPVPGEIVVAINAGGPALTDAGIDFSADQFFTLPSSTFADGNAGNGQQPDFDGTVYETERFGDFSYEIPVAPGVYDVDLHFAEIFLPNSDTSDGIGVRAFDVFIEGVLVLDNYDILEETNGDFNQFLVETFANIDPSTDDDDANINIQFAVNPTLDNAKISGIVVRNADSGVYQPPADDLFGTAVEIADTGDAPSGPVLLAEGTNVMSATQEGEGDGANGVRDRDYFTITIPEGYQLSSLFLDGFDNSNETAPFGFLAFQEGPEVTVDPVSGVGIDSLQGAIIYGSEQVDNDLLALMRAGFDDGQSGNTLPAFDQALTGTWTFWLNQGAGPSTATLDFQVTPYPTIEIGDATDLVEGGDDTQVDDTLLFPITATPAVDGDVTINVTIDINSVQTTEDVVVTFTAGAGEIPVAIAQDNDADGPESVTVTLNSVAGTSGELGTTVSGTGAVTEDDVALAPVGFGPNDDLDQDGDINSTDDDIDGDGALNGVETFRYDATNAGTALAPGESVRLEFDTDGTPFENGLTGALVRPNELPADGNPEEVNLNNADVSGGTLNIAVTAGDHFSNGNSQQNAFVSAYSSENGLSVETRFVIPDYNPGEEGDQAPGNFQASGVVIGVDQNNLVKAVYGRAGAEIELAQDNVSNGGGGAGTTAGTTPEGAEEVAIRLEVFTDPATGNATAKAYYTFFDSSGVVIGDPEQEVGPIVLVDNSTASFTNTLKTLVESGAPLGAGVIQTSTGGGSPSTFDVSYQYLEVSAPDAILVSVADAPTVVEDGDTGDTMLAFPLSLSEATAATLDLVVEYSINGGETQTINLDGVVFDAAGLSDAMIPVPTDDVNDGPESVSVELISVASPAFAIDGDNSTAIGSVSEDDPLPAGDVLFRVNVGGPAVTSVDDGPDWTADQQNFPAAGNSEYLTNNSTGGQLFSTNAAIVPDDSVLLNTPLSVFATERNDPGIQDANNLTYQFPVEAGTTVEVRLFFAEIFGGITGDGQRIMDVAVEGTVDPELNDIDQFAIAGLNGAFMRTVEVVVSEDNILDIEAISELDSERSALKAIEVVKIADPVDTPPEVATPIDAQSADEDAAFSFIVPEGTFADNDGEETLTLSATLGDDSPLPDWLDFDPLTKTFSGTPENDDVAVLTVKVTATDLSDQSVDATFELTVNNTDDAPVVSLLQTELTATAGSVTNIAIATVATASDEDPGDTATLIVTPSDEGISVVDGNLVIADDLAPGDYTIDFGATDDDGTPAIVQQVTLTVTEAPDITPPIAVFADIATVEDDTADIIVQVTITDDRALLNESVDIDAVTLSGLSVTELAASAFEFDAETGIALYTFSPPGGVWEEGDYTASLAAEVISDVAGNQNLASSTQITVDVPLPDISVAISGPLAPVAEAEGAQAFFDVDLSAAVPLGETIEVTYTVGNVGDTATTPEDYVAQSGTLIFTEGQLTQQIAVDLVNDGETEAAETLSVVVTGATFRGEALTVETPIATAEIAEETDNPGTEGDDNIQVQDSDETVDVTGDGEDTISGASSQFDDLVIIGFDEDDKVELTDGTANTEIVRVEEGSTIVGLDINGDGTEDAAIVFDDLEDPTPDSPLTADDFTVEFDEGTDSANVFFTPQTVEVSMTIADGQATTLAEADEDAVEITISLSEASDQDVTVTFEVTGDATAEDFFVDPETSVTIPAGQLSAPVFLEILNDALFEAPEALNLAITSTSEGVISEANGGVSFTITSEDPEPPVIGDPIVIEAEDFTGLGDSDYFAQGSSAASDNGLIRVNIFEPTLVETLLPESISAGVYTVEITYFDESDGQSSATALIGDTEIGSWIFNNDGGGNAAQAQNLRTIEFTQVTIQDGETFKLIGQRDLGEFARIDKITLTRTGDIEENLPPEGDVPDTIVPEGQDVDITFGFTDPEQEDITYDATLLGGEALPTWLILGEDGLTGTPPPEAIGTTLTIEVTATDASGNPTVDTFDLTLADNTGPAPTVLVTPPATLVDPITVTVTFDDASAIDETSVETVDVSLSGPVPVAAASSSDFDAETNTATYTFDAPIEGWTPGDYGADFAEGAVSDVATNTSSAVPSEPFVIAGPTDGKATFTANAGSTAVTSASTFGGGSMVVVNDSANGVQIEKVVFSLAGASIPETVFDPDDGSPAGDSANKSFELGTATGVSEPVVTYGDAFDAGFYEMTLDFAGLAETFDPGDSLTFAIDIDPVSAYSPLGGGAVSGQELMGGTFTVFFSDGTTATGTILPDGAGTVGATAIANTANELPAPTLSLDGETVPTLVNEAVQTITVDAGIDNAGATVRLYILDTAFYVQGGGEGPDLQGNAANAAATVIDAVVGEDGTVDVEVTLTRTDNGSGDDDLNLGINYVTAALLDENGEPGQASSELTIEFDPSAVIGDDDLAPSGDLDGDEIANAVDPDVDGDQILNVDDAFAYDAQNGVLLADGEMIELTFDIDGTPYQNGFTGLLQGTGEGFNEDTGTAVVSDGALIVSANNGDTGGNNNPSDDFQLGLKNGNFTVEARIDNPFQAGAANFDQLGVHVGLDSADFVKLVFGFSAGVVEFSSQTADSEFKATGGNQALPANAGIADFAYADMTLVVTSASPASATITASITFYDESDNVLAADVPYGSIPISGALAAALADDAVGVGTGFTQTQFGGADAPFDAVMQNFKVTANEEAPVLDDVLDILGAIETSAEYTNGEVGSAVFSIIPGATNIQTSNFGNGSFQVQNTGDKAIAAVFIDVRGALYTDSVFDPDGQGGDDVAKAWQVNDAGGTGAFIPGSGYFLPGPAPVAGPGNGGFEGVIAQFTNFENGETATFSGDMDPNSIAGLTKGAVDSGAINGWDVGGVSGAELIGSTVYVLFDDGSISTGQLFGDESQAGSQALIAEDLPGSTATLTVNTVVEGEYGGETPEVIVSGTPGDIVSVILTKGFNPVNNPAIDALVAQRLETDEFGVNNAFDFQTVNVEIPPSGSIDISAEFDYNNTDSGQSFDGDGIQPIAFTAAVIDPTTGLAQGPATDPIRLESNGTPVDGEPPLPDGYYLVENDRLKVQFEDLGTDPGSLWSFFDSADEEGNQSNFQGAGYYEWNDGGYGPDGQVLDGTGLNGPQGELTYTFFIPEGQEGNYTIRVRSSRDSNNPGDARNDVWVKIDDNAEDLLTSDVNVVSNSGFIKLFGNPTGNFGFASGIDSVSDEDPNFTGVFELSAGFHTITFAGRSTGFHLDFFELYKGGAPALGATNSQFIVSGPTVPTVVDPIDDAVIQIGSEFDFTVPAGTFQDLDMDQLDLTAITPDGVDFDENTGVFSGAPTAGLGTYDIIVTATDDDGNSVSDTFTLEVIEEPVSDIVLTLINADTDQVIRVLDPNDVITTSELAGDDYTLVASFTGGQTVGSVQFQTPNGGVLKTETFAPYAFFGDQGEGAFNGESLPEPGSSLEIVVKVFSGPSGTGSEIASRDYSIDIDNGVSDDNAAPVVSDPIDDLTVADGEAVNIDLSGVFSDPDPEDTVTITNVTGLPNGVELDGDSIVGTPTEFGSFDVTVFASDGDASTFDTFDLVVQPPISDSNIALVLVNADTDEVIRVLDPSDTINPAELAGDDYALVVTYGGSEAVGSVQFQTSGGQVLQTETFAPYARFGDEGEGEFNGEALPSVGNTLDLVIKVFSGPSGTGSEIASQAFVIEIDDAPAPAAASFGGPSLASFVALTDDPDAGSTDLESFDASSSQNSEDEWMETMIGGDPVDEFSPELTDLTNDDGLI